MYKNEEIDDGDRKDFKIRGSLVSAERRVSSLNPTQTLRTDVSKYEPSDFNTSGKNKYTKKRKIKQWKRLKRSLSGNLYEKPDVEFVDLARNEQIVELNSYGKCGLNAYILNYIQDAINKVGV